VSVTDSQMRSFSLEQNQTPHVLAAHALMAALPQIQDQVGSVIVIKYGGSLMTDPDNTRGSAGETAENHILANVAWLKAIGFQPIIVHGGGPSINRALSHFQREPEFIRGVRVTDDETLDIVEMVLSGQLNKAIVGRLQTLGCPALGLSGRDAGLIRAERQLRNGVDLGHVGVVQRVDAERLRQLLTLSLVPIISPICEDAEGGALNVNADEVAIAIACALKARQLLLLTDVPGVLADIRDPQSRIPQLTVSAAQEAILSGLITGGMIPKIQSAIDSIRQGVGQVRILDGHAPHSLLSAILFNIDAGTRLLSDDFPFMTAQ
jgi:acetylglutamate kinase